MPQHSEDKKLITEKDFKIFGVIGNPVTHSLSPAMHNAGFKAVGIDAVYLHIAVESFVEALKLSGELSPLSGINITAPFKDEVSEESLRRSCSTYSSLSFDSAAQSLSAVNTVLFRDPTHENPLELKAFNTDPEGVTRTIQEIVELQEKTALVLGAGGAGRAACFALKNAGCKKVYVANRTFEKAQSVAVKFGCIPVQLDAENLKEIFEEAGVIVSTIPTDGTILSKDFLKKSHIVLDASYKEETFLVNCARSCGSTVLDGRKWLLYQGIGAFQYFTGKTLGAEIFKDALDRSPSDTESLHSSHITFIGMMGTGKSTIGKMVAQHLQRKYIDIDRLIEERAKLTIPEIFKVHGEVFFRELEAKILGEVLLLTEPHIISCGGGIILNQKSRALIKEKSYCFWLWSDVDTIVERTSRNKGRPLLSTDEKPEERIKRLLEERVKMYAETAHCIMPTNGGRALTQIKDRICNETSYLRKD